MVSPNEGHIAQGKGKHQKRDGWKVESCRGLSNINTYFQVYFTFQGWTRIRTYDLCNSISTNHDVDHNATEEIYKLVNINDMMKSD